MNEIFMKQIADRHEVTPPGFVWDNIELSLNENKRKRHFFFLISMGVTLISLSVALWLGEINGTNKNSENNFSSGKTKTAAAVSKNEDSIIDSNVKRVLQNYQIEKKEIILKIENISEQTAIVDYNKNKIEKIALTEKPYLDEMQENYKSIEEISFESIPKVLSLLKLPEFDLKFIDRIKCPTFGESKRRMFAEAGLLGGYHNKSIGNGNNEALANIRNTSESAWYSWGMYGAFGLNITPNFFVGTGIDWIQSKDKFNHSSEAITKMIITFDPVTGIPTDTSFVTGKLVNKGEIRYNSIDIPLIIGFVKNYDEWDFGMEVAPIFNLNFKAKGKIFNDKMKISSIENEPPIYKSGLGMGLKASIVIRRNIFDGLSLQLKPTFKTYFSDINDSNYSLPMRYHLFSLNIAVRKDF